MISEILKGDFAPLFLILVNGWDVCVGACVDALDARPADRLLFLRLGGVRIVAFCDDYINCCSFVSAFQLEPRVQLPLTWQRCVRLQNLELLWQR